MDAPSHPTRTYGPNENLTLRRSELEAYQGGRGGVKAGRHVRYFCPIHGSDSQRSLSLNPETGRFQCFACGAWGYLEEAREQWKNEHPAADPLHVRKGPRKAPGRAQRARAVQEPTTPRRPPTGQSKALAHRPDLEVKLEAFRAALPGSPGEAYLNQRGISLEMAQRYGVGYAAPAAWPGRQWKRGRVVFEHRTPAGALINLYGRAVTIEGEDAGKLKHDHLPGSKGYWNAGELTGGTGPVCVCEAPMDALSLLAAGAGRAVAIYGVTGWRWEWAKQAREMAFAFDADRAGQDALKTLAREGALRGKRVWILGGEAYGGCKDANEAWVKGVLCRAALRIEDAPEPTPAAPEPDAAESDERPRQEEPLPAAAEDSGRLPAPPGVPQLEEGRLTFAGLLQAVHLDSLTVTLSAGVPGLGTPGGRPLPEYVAEAAHRYAGRLAVLCRANNLARAKGESLQPYFDAWDAEAALVAAWICYALGSLEALLAMLPPAPFALRPGQYVKDSEAWLDGLLRDYNRGPGSPTGCRVSDDLRAIWGLCGPSAERDAIHALTQTFTNAETSQTGAL